MTAQRRRGDREKHDGESDLHNPPHTVTKLRSVDFYTLHDTPAV